MSRDGNFDNILKKEGLVGWLVGDIFKKEGIPKYFQFTGKSLDKMKLSMIFLEASPRG